MNLIELRNVDKTYHLGEVDVPVLKGVSLDIRRGEFVALMGASGSGKTTLMNLLGCLDRPSSGSFRLEGVEITELTRPQLAALRSSRIGFVFQSFNLLPRTSSLDNVLMPTSYSTQRVGLRKLRLRCRELLESVGLRARLDHAPGQLSGGEQQRVAIARSLVNEPTLLLADEPTGNLDSRTGKEILALFRQLNRERGITLLLVTHDAEVAKHADRVIRMVDGCIVEDSDAEGAAAASPDGTRSEHAPIPVRRARNTLRVLTGAARIAFQAMRRNVMRTALTMLGVIIGVAAVIAMMEISQGASSAIEVTVSNMGANTVLVTPGAPRPGSNASESVNSLFPDDAQAIEEVCPNVVCAVPVVRARASVIFGNRDWRPNYLLGSTPDFLVARNWTEMDLGRAFTDREVAVGAKVCLIGQTLVRELFGERYPVGQEVRIQNEPFTVVGVLSSKGANLLGVDQDDILLAPWTTVKFRVSGGGGAGSRPRTTTSSETAPGPTLTERLPGVGQRVRSENVDQILVQAKSPDAIAPLIDEISHLLRDRHRLGDDESDFRVRDMAEVSNALENTVRLLSGLGLSVAAVSLIVGGVGIMNIMLVSVTERTREIGLRMAVGANANDILRQFLVESVVLCLVGGMIGILAGRATSLLVGEIMDWPTQPSVAAAAVAVAVSVAVGVTFGYYPAWKASRLNPIEALRYE